VAVGGAAERLSEQEGFRWPRAWLRSQRYAELRCNTGTPTGIQINLRDVATLFAQRSGGQPGLTIGLSELEGVVIRYHETHRLPSQDAKTRISTALFSLQGNRVLWRHLHKTLSWVRLRRDIAQLVSTFRCPISDWNSSNLKSLLPACRRVSVTHCRNANSAAALPFAIT